MGEAWEWAKRTGRREGTGTMTRRWGISKARKGLVAMGQREGWMAEMEEGLLTINGEQKFESLAGTNSNKNNLSTIPLPLTSSNFLFPSHSCLRTTKRREKRNKRRKWRKRKRKNQSRKRNFKINSSFRISLPNPCSNNNNNPLLLPHPPPT